MKKVLMSACLLGKKVRYDGRALTLSDQIVEQWRSEGRIIAVCPEVDAGMSTPRIPAEIVDGSGDTVLDGEARVIDKDGGQVTDYFLKGANIALALCQRFDITVAVLAESSPSCGSSTIHDGTFSGNKISGVGGTAALLKRYGVRVFSQHEIEHADKAISG